MTRFASRLAIYFVCASWLAACSSGESNVPTPEPPSRLFDPLAYQSLPGAPRASGVRDGLLRSYVHRQGPLLMQLLARSGSSPAFIATFPRSDRGIGIWFQRAPESTQLYAGAASGAEALAAGGELVAVLRDEGQHRLEGVRGTLKSDAVRLSTELVLLGSAGAVRDYGGKVCLEDGARFPGVRDEQFELDAERNALRIHRGDSGSAPELELLLIGTHGTRIHLHARRERARPAHSTGAPQSQPIIVLTNRSGIELEFIALASEATATATIDDAPAGVRSPSSPRVP
jgi:hypothetical protein